ncbi:NUDIX hydrolase [Rossellomorea aquimaris]|uniref:NUDIX hydrolase n=1 Tax=Rossellomorea aquimaris TaxID=189382 RepID=UPI0007D04BCC|nr:NUDIX hydrolase [Rossellomorea aquimaris]
MGYIEELRLIVGNRPLILVGAVVIILNNKNQVLLQQRTFPHGSWGLPGGLMELAESTEETARREVKEETNLELGDLTLLNVYSGADQYIKAENGDEFYVVTTAYYSDEFEGELIAESAESIQIKFFHFEDLPTKMVRSHKGMLSEYKEKYYSSQSK